jgi:hypothetical protein
MLEYCATLLDLLQTSPIGTSTLDALIRRFLQSTILGGRPVADPEPTIRWSEDLDALVQLVPLDHDFSLGERDSVLWAWIQPSDAWTPSAHEMRHDHPRGSGLIVAQTLPLAMAAALVALRSHSALPTSPPDAC